ncbi:hypothetical protein FVR03_18840 [Pontibacter qinzhouensis]|uniref:Uncharacterized protein n=1 Tax=Pontibacter qinzhouensis TaxID=2603253 RepID=A0A5C8J8L3_9BACT|nr:hypothetical protein [Pontibacter qinzhouensis]TXK33762.1 hypothetical protein FVR03_18840 [Pontibacter qinzhouensis]
MLRHLTWTQFFLTAGTCLLLYYATVLWLFYRHAIKALLAKTVDRLLPKVYLTSSRQEVPLPTNADTTAAGSVRNVETLVLTEAAELQFAPISEETEADEANEPSLDTALPNGSASAPTLPHQADFLQEITSLLELVAETSMEKEEFLSLLRLITARYSRTVQARQREKLQLFLLQETQASLPFPLHPEDLQELWSDA